MEAIEIITGPASTSVSTDDLKAHLRLNDDSEDSLLGDWLTAADDLFTRWTGYVLVSQTLRLRLDGWPSDGTVYVPRHPVTGIASVQYLDRDGTWQTVDPSNYSIDLGSVPARVRFGSGYTFPSLHPTAVPTVRVQFVAGGTAPKLAAQAVKLLAAHWYAQREAFGEANLNEVPMGFKAVCHQYTTGVLGCWNEVM